MCAALANQWTCNAVALQTHIQAKSSSPFKIIADSDQIILRSIRYEVRTLRELILELELPVRAFIFFFPLENEWDFF